MKTERKCPVLVGQTFLNFESFESGLAALVSSLENPILIASHLSRLTISPYHFSFRFRTKTKKVVKLRSYFLSNSFIFSVTVAKTVKRDFDSAMREGIKDESFG